MTKKQRRTRLDPEQRRGELIDNAVSAFAEHGVARATQSHVAQRAGVAVSTVYAYFRTREDLVEATLAEVEAFMDRIFQESLSGAESSFEELVSLAQAFARVARETPALMMVWLDWSTSVSSASWPKYLQQLAKWRGAVVASIRRGQRRGDVSSAINPRIAARLYNGGGHTIALMVFEDVSKRELNHFIDQLVRGVLGYAAVEKGAKAAATGQ